MAKMFEVKLKPGHPTGQYTRGGVTFTTRLVTTIVQDPVRLTEDQITEEMKTDAWLEISEVKEEPKDRRLGSK